jgi:TonB family protein
MKRRIALVILALLLCEFSHAQQSPSSDWVHLETSEKEVSFEMPKNFFYAFDNAGFTLTNPKNWRERIEYKEVHSLTAYENGATMFFESYASNRSRSGLEFFPRYLGNETYQNLDFDTFKGIYTTNEKAAYLAFHIFASKNTTYVFAVGAPDKENQTLVRFLSSVKLNQKRLFDRHPTNLTESSQSLTISSLQETPVEVADLTGEELNPKVSSNNGITIRSPEEKNAATSKGLILLFKPRPPYTDTARRAQVQGSLRLRVSFLNNGHIGEIHVIKGLHPDLVQNAVKAAKRIKFIPAQVNGVATTVVKTVEYGFTLF